MGSAAAANHASATPSVEEVWQLLGRADVIVRTARGFRPRHPPALRGAGPGLAPRRRPGLGAHTRAAGARAAAGYRRATLMPEEPPGPAGTGGDQVGDVAVGELLPVPAAPAAAHNGHAGRRPGRRPLFADDRQGPFVRHG